MDEDEKKATLSSFILTVLPFWFGLAQTPMEQQVVVLATGLVRLNALVAVCLMQAWLTWNCIMFQVKRIREAEAYAVSSAANANYSISIHMFINRVL